MPDCKSIAQISVMRSNTSNPFRILLTWITSLQRMCSATFVPSLPCVCHLLRISRLCGLRIGPRFLATLRSTKSTTAGSWHHPFGTFPCSSLACFVYLWFLFFAMDVHWTLPCLLGCCPSIEVFFTPCLSWCLPFDFLDCTCPFSHIQSDNLAHLCLDSLSSCPPWSGFCPLVCL